MNVKLAALPLGLVATGVLAQDVSLEALLELIESQEMRIAELERRLDQTGDELEATVDFVEALEPATRADATTIGGYGELHYNNLDASDASNDLDEIDFHRFVLFVSHRLSDRIQFSSEIEIEHSLAGDGAPGEIELEQAYVDIALKDSLRAKAGLFLLPIGFLNETHEPPTFYGVERNNVENVIIPTTWWEAGGGFSGDLKNGIGWDVMMHSGLEMPTSGGSAFRVRSGRQKVAEAIADNWAYTARLRYAGLPGLELGASLQYQSDPSQVAGDGLDSGRLFSANLSYEIDKFMIKALYGSWRFQGAAVEAAGADRQDGWFVEPSYRLNPRWGLFARYEEVEGARAVDQFSEAGAGFNFWPHPSVVLKFDYRQRDLDQPALAGNDFDGFDLGIGYQF
ncbi:MAG: porin [Gammaproteobacteria bacterium]